jgi:hypothetical protein
MKAERTKAAGASGKTPLPGQSSLSLFSFARVRNDYVSMHDALRVSSPDFQTCRIADSPKSAGRKAALEVGLEIWAATGTQP